MPISFADYARLFGKLPRPSNSEVIFAVFESSYHLLLPVLPLNGKDNPVKALSTLPKDTTSELADLSSPYPF